MGKDEAVEMVVQPGDSAAAIFSPQVCTPKWEAVIVSGSCLGSAGLSALQSSSAPARLSSSWCLGINHLLTMFYFPLHNAELLVYASESYWLQKFSKHKSSRRNNFGNWRCKPQMFDSPISRKLCMILLKPASSSGEEKLVLFLVAQKWSIDVKSGHISKRQFSYKFKETHI